MDWSWVVVLTTKGAEQTIHDPTAFGINIIILCISGSPLFYGYGWLVPEDEDHVYKYLFLYLFVMIEGVEQ